MIYIIVIPILVLLVIHSNKLLKADQKEMLDELTERLELEEWQIRKLSKYLENGRC